MGQKTVVLHATAARTATGQSAAVCGLARYDKFAIQLDVDAASGTTPTLDVTVQHSVDGGVNWNTVTVFAQKTAASQEFKTESEVESATAEVYGDCWRVSYVIAGTTPSFTFNVTMTAQD